MNALEDLAEGAKVPAPVIADAVLVALEDAGSITAKLILSLRGDDQAIALLHDLIGDLCVARIGAQLLQRAQQQEDRIEE